MRKVVVVLIALLSMGWTLAVTRAQEPLTQTYTAPDGSYSFQYPEGWQSQDAGTGYPPVFLAEDMGAYGSIGFAVNQPNHPTTLDAFQASDTLITQKHGNVTPLQIGGHDALRIDVPANADTPELLTFVIQFPDNLGLPNNLAILQFLAQDQDHLNQLEPILVAIGASFQVPASGGALTTGDPNAAVAATTVPAAATSAPTEATVQRPVINGVSTIAFTSTDLDRAGIAVTDPTGQNVTPITHNKFTDWLPAFSPDGTMIAFVAEDDPVKFDAWNVYVVGSNGGEPRKISSKPSTNPAAVAWSPDSKQLIFISTRADADGGPGIYKVNVDGSGEQKLGLDGMDGKFLTLDLLAWSPDGNRIAFVGVPPGANDWTFVFADADGTHLTAGPDFNIAQVGTTFQWSPDGQHALYSDQTSLEVTAADGTNPTVLVDKSENLRLMGASWSPDGTQIAFAAVDQTGTVPALYVMNADGSNRQKLDLGQHDVATLGVSWGVVPTDLGQTGAAPAQPTTSASGAACSVTAINLTNLRSGPGTTFDKTGTLAAGASASVTGQATGADGKVWYQLDGGSYVRSDLVTANGDCASVPTVSP